MICTNIEIDVVRETLDGVAPQSPEFSQAIGTPCVNKDERQLDLHVLETM